MRYAVEHLPNGMYRVRCYASGLVGCYARLGTYVFGDLKLSRREASNVLRAHYPDHFED